jgi:hypothetical protein
MNRDVVREFAQKSLKQAYAVSDFDRETLATQLLGALGALDELDEQQAHIAVLETALVVDMEHYATAADILRRLIREQVVNTHVGHSPEAHKADADAWKWRKADKARAALTAAPERTRALAGLPAKLNATADGIAASAARLRDAYNDGRAQGMRESATELAAAMGMEVGDDTTSD